MNYQLVIQFPESAASFDQLIELEDAFDEQLEGSFDIDGHDFGSGEGNIFILTDEPKKVFERVRVIVEAKNIEGMKAAYRPTNGETFVILWPPNLTSFKVI